MGDESVLANLCVLDLSQGVAGAYAAKLFADYGADVIKVEPPGAGDPTRREGPFPDKPDPETGALWLYLNTNKRSITLDIAQPAGASLLRRLVEHAQVVIESFSPGYLDSLGLGFQALTEIKRRLVLTSITPFGQSGPYAQFKATDLTLLAGSGRLSAGGDRQRRSLEGPGHQAEYQAGLHAFAASAVAGYGADSSELPERIDISVQECLVATPVDVLPAALHEVDHPKAGRLAPFRLSEIDWRPVARPAWASTTRRSTVTGSASAPRSLQACARRGVV